MYKAPHILIAGFYRDNYGIAESFAHPFGVHKNVPDAWGRPKPSELNPTGTGKGNPLDQSDRFIRIVHPVDPVRAREMAENYLFLVNHLDCEKGITHACEERSPTGLLAKSICEHADVAAALLIGEITQAKLTTALVEIREAEVALLQLKGCVEGLIKSGEFR